MSNTQLAFLNRDDVPSRESWQAAIDELKFKVDLKLDAELQPFDDEGFSPCLWGNASEDVGFEIYYESAEDVHEGDEDFMSVIGDKDYCVSMCWGGSLKDCAAVMIASSALATKFGAIISYEGNEPEALSKLISDSREIVSEAMANDA